MKIYFHCSLAGEKQYFKEYSMLIKSFKELKHEVFLDHILKKKYTSYSEESKKEIYEDIKEKKRIIKSCDAIAVESTYPSIGIGYIIAYALGQHKSVLILYQDTPHAVFIGETNRLLTLKKYNVKDKRKLLHDLEVFLENAKKKVLKYRFNMMIDPSMNDFLSFEASKKHVSKADYVRQLLIEKINLSKRYAS